MGNLTGASGPEAEVGAVAVAAGHRRGGHHVVPNAHRIIWRQSPRGPEPVGGADVRSAGGAPIDTDPAELRVAAERQRIAGVLHDDVGSALFAIAAGVARTQALQTVDVDELRRTLDRIGVQVLDASYRLREVLRSCTPAEPAEGVPASAQRDLDDLAERSGIHAHLVLRGVPRALPARTERAALNCLRQALFNIERHAAATTVIVTLDYTPGEFLLVVQDDGRGLPDAFEPRAVPTAGHHWGFASMARQVEQRGGELDLRAGDEGGTRLRVRLPA